MKILAIIGSPRKNGNTHLLTKEVLSYLDKDKYDSEMIFIKDYTFSGCIACNGCQSSTDCIIKDDMQVIHQKMKEADALILASPTYYYNVTSDMKKLIDRFFCLNIFDKLDRSKWTSYNHIHGIKPAITISVCEQNSYDDLGFTTEAMARPLQDIGYDVIYKLEAIKAFNKGDILRNKEDMQKAEYSANQLNEYFESRQKLVI